MTFKQNLQTLRGYKRTAPSDNIEKINKVIELYEAQKIRNFRTALNTIELLATRHKAILRSGKQEKEYNKLVEKYQEAPSMVGRLSDPIFKPVRGDYTKASPNTRINIFQGTKPRTTLNNVKKYIYKEMEEAFKYQKAMKLKMSLQVRMTKTVEEFDGRTYEKEEMNTFSTSKAKRITKSIYKQIIDEFLEELLTKIHETEQK